MAIYVFNLLAGYPLNGVNYARGRRASYLKKLNTSVKYIYTTLPTDTSIAQEEHMGISSSDMLSAHLFMCGINELGRISQKDFYNAKHQLIAREYYHTDILLYTEYFDANNTSIRKTFKEPDGTTAYDIVYTAAGEERFIFPSGEILSIQGFFNKFIEKLNLSSSDIILIDKGGNDKYVQPLFSRCTGAKIIVFLHGGHYSIKGESSYFLYFNFEYFYWFSHTHLIHTMLVSTELQKKELEQKLQEYNLHIPNIEVILASGLDKFHYPALSRKPYSLLTVSRLDSCKRLDWIIHSTIKAHKINPLISLDIYGEGPSWIAQSLQQIVNENHAESYIHFMGHCDVSEKYAQYEVFISASVFETLGLSIMEAIGSGNALIGLDVKYGNRQFIKHNYNGLLTNFDISLQDEPGYVEKVIQDISNNILALFSDQEKLITFQQNSYKIANDFLNSKIEKAWLDFFTKILNN